jgi:HD-GYP domain-containing protein (c-di-GMP phosphodiesterase class II)
MNESKLNMSKLASESGNPAVRTASGGRDNEREKLNLSRLEGAVNSGGAASGVRTESRLYPEALKCLAEVYDAVRLEKAFSVDPGVTVIRKMVDNLPQESDALLLAAIHGDYREDTVVHHSVNVAILAVMIGSHLGITGSGLVKLGAAALFHDIGTTRVPDGIFYKPSALSDDELRQLRQRPLFSQQILSRLDTSNAYLSEVAIQVYERLDGSGYPSGLKKGDIHEHARIIGLVDVYEALIHSRPHRDRFLHFPAIKEILRSGKPSFDRRHLKALVDVVSLLPVFSFVRLNSGAIGRVLESDPQHPLRPLVKILYDSQERPVSAERIVNLKENALLFVADAVAEDSINAGFAS